MKDIIRYEDYAGWIERGSSKRVPEEDLSSRSETGPIAYRRRHVHRPGGFVDTYCRER